MPARNIEHVNPCMRCLVAHLKNKPVPQQTGACGFARLPVQKRPNRFAQYIGAVFVRLRGEAGGGKTHHSALDRGTGLVSYCSGYCHPQERSRRREMPAAKKSKNASLDSIRTSFVVWGYPLS